MLRKGSFKLGTQQASLLDENPRSADELFADDIERAIRLRQMFFQREIDHQFESDGGRIIYAVDSNILNMHFQLADQKAPRSFELACRAFEGPTEDRPEARETRLAQVIISYIVSKIGFPYPDRLNPILMLPGHSEEAKGRYGALIGKFDKQVDRGRKARMLISEFLQEFHEQQNDEARRELTEAFEAELHKQLFILSEPHEKFREFNRLLAEPRLLSLRRAGSQRNLRDLKNPVTSLPIFHDFKSTDEDLRHEGSAAWWDKRLSKDIPIWFVPADKDALSTLDKLNRLLRRHDVRIVLFTLGENIVQLGEKYRPYKHTDSDLGAFSFTDLYLRHPKALLSEPQNFKLHLDGQRRGDISVWLDTFLQEVTGREYETFEDFKKSIRKYANEKRGLMELSRKAISEHPNIHDALYSQWKDYLESATLAPAAMSYEAKDVFASYLEDAGENGMKLVAEFESYIRKLTEDSWDDFFFTTLRSGSDMIGAKQGYNNRNVPILFLRGMGAAGELLKEISRSDGVIKNEAQVRALLSDLNRDRDDFGGYISSICYAILFAHADRWSITKLIASRAVQVAAKIRQRAGKHNEPVTTFGEVTGREAYYLSAVAHRLTARRAGDLDECEKLLSDAVAAMELETELDDVVPDYPQVTGLRFRAEAFAIEIAKLMFRARSQHWILSNDAVLESDVRSLMDRILTELRRPPKCKDEFICAASRLSLRGNIINCVFLLEAANALQDEDGALASSLLEDHLADLDYVFGIDENASKLSVLDIYLTMYAASFNHVVNELLERIDRAYNEIEARPDRRKSISAMPYDKKRYELIVNFIDMR